MRQVSPDDLPFYNGQPYQITWQDWFAILTATICGFIVLIAPPALLRSGPAAIFPALIFAMLPFVTLAIVSGGRITALFRRYGLKAFAQSILFAALTFVVSVTVGLALVDRVTMAENPIGDTLTSLQHGQIAWFLLETFIQLVGEEVATILPLLAVLWGCYTVLQLSFRISLSIAVALSTLWFSAMHLPTYDWNLVQCFGVIGISRLILTTAYLYTRNLWVSASAHIANDWLMFALVHAGGHFNVGE